MNPPHNPDDIPSFDRVAPVLAGYSRQAIQVLLSVGEEAFELVVALLVMIMVEQTYGQRGLGVYAYLTACLFVARYVANFGVARFVEHETAVCEQPARQQEVVHRGYQAVMIGSLTVGLLLTLTAGFDTVHTHVEERALAYLIIALNLPAANLNHLKFSILQGLGQHGRVARLRMVRYGLVLAGMFVFTRLGVRPSYLVGAFLLADVCMARVIGRHVKLPKGWNFLNNPRSVKDTLKQGYAFLFTDNGLDVLLNMDLFVLGLFVSAWDLGIYAEAAVIVRFFLVVPAGIKPILRRQYTLLASHHEATPLVDLFRRRTVLLFSLHAILALLVLLYFPAVLNLLFETRGEELRSFKLFAEFVPGLIYYGAFSAQETLYEASGRMQGLKRVTVLVAGANFLLTFYLVPFAGLTGAAAATMLTMLLHFGLFGMDLKVRYHMDKLTYVVARSEVYLIYMLLKWLAWGSAINFWLGPLGLMLLFYLSGLFGVGDRALHRSSVCE